MRVEWQIHGEEVTLLSLLGEAKELAIDELHRRLGRQALTSVAQVTLRAPLPGPAMVGSGSKNARATSAVLSPPNSRNVSTARASGDSTG